jgi:integrase
MGTLSELNNLKCEKAKPNLKPYRLTDQHGLHLLITPQGGKLWRWKYMFEGKQKEMALGKYPEISLANARVLHSQARALLATGVDPMALRKEAKKEVKAKQELQSQAEKDNGFTFEALARQWLAWWREDKNERYALASERRFETDIFPVIGKWHPKKITRADIVRLIQGVDGRGVHNVALRELQHISQVYEHGIDCCLVDVNPASGIRPKHILSRKTAQNFARLEIKDVPELLGKIRDYGGNVLVRMAMELLSLTFVRTGELIGGRWEEIDFEKKQWRIPGERMKMKTVHIVPLAKQSIQLLEQLYRMTGNTPYLFPKIRTLRYETMSLNTLLKMLERLGYRKRMTGHGWRGIASTWLREHGYLREYVETQLAHLNGNATERAYNYAQYLDQRAEMMQAWADALDEMRNSISSRIRLVA